MKYFKVMGELIVGTDNLTKDDLIRAKIRTYDAIVNRIEETVYNPKDNTWEPIKNIDVAE